MSEEEANQDEAEWFKPKMADFNTFLSLVSQWLSGVSKADEPQEIEVAPKDSISQVSICESRARSFSVASASLKVEAERAVILAQVAALKEKHKLEDREDELNREKQTLKKKREVLELKALLEASSAKLAVLMSAGKQQGTAATVKARLPSDGQDDLNAYPAEMSKMYTSECEFLSLEKVSKAFSVAHTPSVRPRNGVQPNPVLQQSNEQNGVSKKHESVQATSTFNVHALTNSSKISSVFKQFSDQCSQTSKTSTSTDIHHGNLVKILQRQNEVTSLLVKKSQFPISQSRST